MDHMCELLLVAQLADVVEHDLHENLCDQPEQVEALR